MQTWDYRKIRRHLNLSTAPLKSKPETGTTFIWEDIQEENDPNRTMDEMGRLKQLGSEGWELISVLSEHGDRKYTYTYYLKRPIE